MRAEPLEPEVAAALEAIDATLHGEPADPEYAELAELSLILRDDRPEIDLAFARQLDHEMATGFADRSRTRPRRRWVPRGIGAIWLSGGAAVAAAVVLAIVLVGGSGGSSSSSSSFSSSSSAAAVPSTSSSGGASSAAAAGPGVKASANPRSRQLGPAPVPRPASGRKLTQSARLVLVAAPGKVDRVARQVFGVVGAEHGYVSGSNVASQQVGTSTARFTLRVPSSRLQATLTRLSQLSDARVSSRSDSSHDVTARIDGDRSQLTEARAARQALLRQLADADTSKEVLADERALRRNRTTIADDETALAGLRGRVSYSAIAVSVSGSAIRATHRHHAASGGGLSLGRGLHDAGRVLVVAASVALIVLAVLVPLSVLAGIAAWIWLAVRRRAREQALGPRG